MILGASCLSGNGALGIAGYDNTVVDKGRIGSEDGIGRSADSEAMTVGM